MQIVNQHSVENDCRTYMRMHCLEDLQNAFASIAESNPSLVTVLAQSINLIIDVHLGWLRLLEGSRWDRDEESSPIHAQIPLSF